MGQQQLLLILLGIIIIAIAIAVSISIFRQGAIDSKRDLLTNESSVIATLAIRYYNRPDVYGGGNYSFSGWVIPEQLLNTASGSYITQNFGDSVYIIGTGNEVVSGTDSVKIKTIVVRNSFRTEIIN